MVKQFNLSVKTPCQEDFNQFKPTLLGGFCDSCQKEVVDFTTMSALEIIDYFSSNNTQNTCGRFKSKQLKTYNMKNQRNKKMSLLTGIGLACLTLFSFSTLQAQETNANASQTASTQDGFVVQGQVADDVGPLPGVNIILKGTKIGVATDFEGKFTFPQKLKKGDVLIFTYVGFESQKIVITDAHSAANISLKVDMELTEIVITGKVATKKLYKSKKN